MADGAPAAATAARAKARTALRRLAPQTMGGLITLGCVLAALPPLLILLLAGADLDHVNRRSRLLLEERVAVVHGGTQLVDDVGGLERAVRQYAVLRDPALVGVVVSRIARSERTLADLESQQLAAFSGRIPALRQALDLAARQAAQAPPDPQALERLAQSLQEIQGQLEAALRAGHEAGDAQIDQLRRAGSVAKRTMLVSALSLLPLAAVFALVFSLSVARPLKGLRRSIIDLGNGRYGDPVKIRFPVEMRRLGQQLDWLRRRLSQLEADKDRFLRDVSHELKTPLASLSEGTALLYEESLGPLTVQQRELASIMARSTAELSSLIDDLLIYAQWRAQRQQPSPDWFEAREFAEDVLQRHQAWLARRHLSAALRVHAQHLFGHRGQLRTVLENLVSNAIKHAPEHTVIEIDIAAREGRCELSVRDCGGGVLEREKWRIFEPFVRGTGCEHAAIQGSGVGLAIVRETVLSHHGMVEVEDAAPGARFRLVWPYPLRQ